MTLPVCSSGFPSSLMWPFSPISLSHASHFCMYFCSCSEDSADRLLPRNRNVNSLIESLLHLTSHARKDLWRASMRRRVARARRGAHGNDDEGLWRAFHRDDGRSNKVAVRPEFGAHPDVCIG